MEWAGLGFGTILPMVALISLFCIRARRAAKDKYDGLGLLLLSLIACFAFTFLCKMLPSFGVWLIGAVLLLLILIPLLWVRMARAKEDMFSDVNLLTFA
jgi:Flp pilus assembly protein TadB